MIYSLSFYLKYPRFFFWSNISLERNKNDKESQLKRKKEDSYIKEQELESKDQFTGINNTNCYRVVRNQNVYLIKRHTGRYIQGKKENVILINSSLQAIAGFLLNNYTLLAMEKVGGLNDSLWTLFLKDKLMRGNHWGASWLEGKNTCHSCKRQRFHSWTYMVASDSVSGLLDILFWELCTECIYIHTDKCTHEIK